MTAVQTAFAPAWHAELDLAYARDGAATRLPLSGAHLSAFRVVAFLRRRFGACSLGFVLKRS